MEIRGGGSGGQMLLQGGHRFPNHDFGPESSTSWRELDELAEGSWRREKDQTACSPAAGYSTLATYHPSGLRSTAGYYGPAIFQPAGILAGYSIPAVYQLAGQSAGYCRLVTDHISGPLADYGTQDAGDALFRQRDHSNHYK